MFVAILLDNAGHTQFVGLPSECWLNKFRKTQQISRKSISDLVHGAVLLEKLTGLQLVKNFPAFHGNRRFITALTSVRHLSLSWASPIQSIYPYPTSWRSIVILSTRLRLGLPSGLLPSGFPTQTLYTPSPHPYASHAQPISFFSILSPAQYWVRGKSIYGSICGYKFEYLDIATLADRLVKKNVNVSRLT